MARGKGRRGRGSKAKEAQEGEGENMADVQEEQSLEQVEGEAEQDEFETEETENDDAILVDDADNTGGDDKADGNGADASETKEAEEETPMEAEDSAQETKTKEKASEETKQESSEEKTAAGEEEDNKEEAPKEEEPKKEEPKEEEPKREKKKKKERTRPYELEKYWKAVKTNPADFTGWTYLLQFVEQEDYMPFYREAFDAFFDHYPYCYGYWKKYADAERKKGSMDKCWAVFERGLKSIPLSSDLWLHFISVSGQNIPRSDETRADKLRALYERATDSAGMDFRSDKLWDQYITFEKKENKDWKRVMQLYDRILKIPTQLYRHHFDKLKEFVQAHLPKEYLDLDEFLSIREQVVAEATPVEAEGDDDAGIPGEDAPPGEDEAPPGEEAPPGIGAPSSKVIEGENKLIQANVIESRRLIFRETEKEVSKRWAYEEAIRRPYFHAKPLEKGQLKTWREYLEFEETTGQHDRVVLLFERCLIACALYEEFWLKYARYMGKTSMEEASKVFKRACGTHLPTKPAINIQWAAFEEKHGNTENAREILEKLQTRQQDSVMIRLERINFERRAGNLEEVIRLYEGCIDDAKTSTGQSFFAGKLARFYQKVMGDSDRAVDVLQKVLEQKQVSPVLKEQIYTLLLDVEYQRVPINEVKMTEVFDAAIASNVSQDVKIQFAQRKIQFLQDFGMNPAATHDAVDEHQRLVKNPSAGKKRTADATGDASSNNSSTPSNDSKGPDKKKAKSGGSNSSGYNNSNNSYNYNSYNNQQGQGGQGGQGQVAQGQAAAGTSGSDYASSWSSWGSYFQQQ